MLLDVGLAGPRWDRPRLDSHRADGDFSAQESAEAGAHGDVAPGETFLLAAQEFDELIVAILTDFRPPVGGSNRARGSLGPDGFQESVEN